MRKIERDDIWGSLERSKAGRKKGGGGKKKCKQREIRNVHLLVLAQVKHTQYSHKLTHRAFAMTQTQESG